METVTSSTPHLPTGLNIKHQKTESTKTIPLEHQLCMSQIYLLLYRSYQPQHRVSTKHPQKATTIKNEKEKTSATDTHPQAKQ